jgi:tRNA threonylcarbamoyladenosine biosynthesis protein TsaB
MKNKKQIVLAVETALFPGSVSILEDLWEIDFRVGEAEISRSEDLLPIISDLLQKNRIHPRQIDLIGVSTGPGSFTGVRVGLATAKGLALGIECLCVGVPTLEVLAVSAEKKGKVRSIISGGRAEVFYQDFYFESADSWRKLSAFQTSELESLVGEHNLNDLDAIVLDEKAKQKHLSFNDSAEIIFQPLNPAKYVGLIALENFKNGVSGELLPQYAQASEIGKSSKG